MPPDCPVQGWQAHPPAQLPARPFLCTKVAFRGVLELTYADGSKAYLGSNTSDWKAGIAGLRNPFYKGAHLVCRTHQKGIRSNTYDIIPREDWEVIEGCHEAIVTPEEWEQVQDVYKRQVFVPLQHFPGFQNQCSFRVSDDIRRWKIL